MPYPQPGTPYAKIFFGSREATGLDSKSLLSFEYERGTVKGTGRCQVTLVDQNFDQIEKALLSADGKFSFEYGWIEGPWSEDRFELALQKYQLKLGNEHTEISFEGKTIGNLLAGENPSISPNTNTADADNIGEAMEERCKRLGIKTNISKTKDNPKRAADVAGTTLISPKSLLFGTSHKQDDNLNIAHVAVNNDGQGGYYRFFFDKKGEVTYYSRNRSDPPLRKNVRDYYVPNKEGSAFEVISFEPDFNQPAMSAVDNQALRIKHGTNHMTGEVVVNTVKQTSGSSAVNSILGSGAMTDYEQDKDYRTQEHGENYGGRGHGEHAGSTEELITENSAFYCDRALNVNRATLILVGDPGLRLCDEINITVWKTGTIYRHASEPQPHYTSGSWLIVGIKDTIQPGDFRSTLTLKKLTATAKPNSVLHHELRGSKSNTKTGKIFESLW